jgi:hypothetical protein
MKKKISLSKDKVSFKHRCTYGSDGDWELHVYTQPKNIPREKFDKDCGPNPPKEKLGRMSIKEMIDRLKIYIGYAIGSQEEPYTELAQLLAPNFDDARLLIDDGHAIVITAESGRDYYLFKYTTR